MSFSTFSYLRRLFRLDLTVFDEIARDGSATVPALLIAVVSVAMLGIGGWTWWDGSGLGEPREVFMRTVVLGTAFGVAAWLGWLVASYMVLSRFGRVAVDVGALVRTAGFACMPLVFALLMIVRPLAFGFGIFALAAWVCATQHAMQHATRRDSAHVTVANIAGFGAWSLVMSLLTTATNQFGQGPFLAESIWEAVTGSRVLLGG